MRLRFDDEGDTLEAHMHECQSNKTNNLQRIPRATPTRTMTMKEEAPAVMVAVERFVEQPVPALALQ